jgi:peptidoglycan/xylan/chitin deacetylase (PgdA/CDA1 family)
MLTALHKHRGLFITGCIAVFIIILLSVKSFSTLVNAEERYTIQLVSEQPTGDLKRIEPEKYNGKIRKIAYLTFDDGPSLYQKSILDVLAQHDIKATFFLVGPNVANHKESMKRLVKEGHYPGLHSMTHNYKRLYQEGQIAVEMKQVQAIVQEVTGVKANLTRCPYGSMPGLTKPLRDQLVADGFKEWDWTIDSLDWKFPGNPNAVTHAVLSKVSKNVEVILLHEKEQSLQALPAIIEGLQNKGYDFEVYNENAHFSLNFWHDNRM